MSDSTTDEVATPDDGPPAPTTAAIVLAAGSGSRFLSSRHKLLAEIDGIPIIRRAIEAARTASIGPVIVVTGAIDAVNHAWPCGPPPDVHVIANPRWSEGQATSLRTGIDAARRLGADAVVVGLADQPFIEPAAWHEVASSTSPIAVANYAGRRRNPVRLAAEVWPLLPTGGDTGARSLISMRPELVDDVPCPGSPDDIDTTEDLASWQSRSSTNSP